MRRIALVALVLTAPLLAQTSAQSLTRVKDINAVPLALGSGVITAAADPHGARPQDADHFVVIGGRAFFVATDEAHGAELWVTDGTIGGTQLVKDIYPGTGTSSPAHLFAWNGLLWFSADNGVVGSELWASDGTAAGTQLVADLHPESGGPSQFAPISPTRLAFRARNQLTTNITWTLWTTNGTAAGTWQVTPTSSPLEPDEITPLAGVGVVFRHNGTNQLWASDGTMAGTRNISAASGPFSPGFLQPVGTRVFFTAHNQPDTTGPELWVTDGTVAGTLFVKDVLPGLGGGANLGICAAWNGELWFRGNDSPLPGGNHQIWRSNGTTAGTVQFTTGLPFPWILEPTPLGLCFGTSQDVYLTNGTVAGTAPLPGGPTGGTITMMKYAAGRLWWRNASSSLDELWMSDFTAAGTGSLAGFGVGPAGGGFQGPLGLVPLGPGPGSVVLAGNDGVRGLEPWRIDGTLAGNVLLADIFGAARTASSQPVHFCELDAGRTCFAADDGMHGVELWITDGTVAGTQMVVDIDGSPYSSGPSSLVRLGNRIVFAADDGVNGNELWITDGTAAGTVLLKDIDPIASSSPSFLTEVRGRVYFSASSGNGDHELWVTDGTTAGTVLVRDIDPAGSSTPRHLCEVGYSGRFVFAAEVGGDRELWISDGTSAGTILLRDITAAGSGGPIDMTRVGDRVVFSAWHPNWGVEPWLTDGTTAGTVLLKDLDPGPGSSTPHSFAPYDGGFEFLAFTPAAGLEPWRSNGTAAGTQLLLDMVPGPNHMQPSHLTRMGNRGLFVAADDGIHGRELWLLQGPPIGFSYIFGEINPGPGSSNPEAYTNERPMFQDSFGRMFFAADDGIRGIELYMAVQGAWARTIDRPCGVSSQLPALNASAPVLGTFCDFTVRNAPFPSFHAIALSLAPPPPVDLGGGCRNHIGGIVIWPFGVGATPNGPWTQSLLVPNDPALSGLPLSAQLIYSLTGLAVHGRSNGVWLQLGR